MWKCIQGQSSHSGHACFSALDPVYHSCRFNEQQRPLLQAAQSPLPTSIFKPQPVAFGSPAPAPQPSRFAPASNQAHTQRALIPQPASQGVSNQRSDQIQPGQLPRQITVATSGTLTNASTDDSESGQSSRQGAVAASWTPMRATADLSRQALANKLMKGKQLPPNSLIAAGLDPTRSAASPRPQSIRRFKGQSYVIDRLAVQLMSSCMQLVAAANLGCHVYTADTFSHSCLFCKMCSHIHQGTMYVLPAYQVCSSLVTVQCPSILLAW